MKEKFKIYLLDILTAIFAGIVVGIAYYFFQNSNGFAPGSVGGLATIIYHLLQSKGIEFSWVILMLLFNAPIFVLVSIFVNRRLGLILLLYSDSSDVEKLGIGCFDSVIDLKLWLLNLL